MMLTLLLLAAGDAPAPVNSAVAVLAVLRPLAAQREEDLSQVGVVRSRERGRDIVASSAASLRRRARALKDELRTGAQGRIQVIFMDDTELTLGENASVVIDRYAYDPAKGIGDTTLQTIKGAFRFATGRINKLKLKTILISTAFANIGVRGMEFWGGPIDAKYGVLLLEGEVIVSNRASSVTLSKTGEGSNIASPLEAPAHPASGRRRRSPAP